MSQLTPSDATNATPPPVYRPSGYCPRCDYPIDPGRCPECGLDVEVPAPHTRRHRRRRAWKLVLAGALTGTVIALAWRHGPELAARYLPDRWLYALSQGASFVPDRVQDWAYEQFELRRWAFLQNEKPAIDSRSNRIDAELRASSAPDWAGDYRWYLFDGREHLKLAPRAGFVYDGKKREDNHGSVEPLAPDIVRLVPAIDRMYTGPETAEGEFLFIHWGQRRLLVPRGRMVGLCNYYNFGDHQITYGAHETIRLGSLDVLTYLTRVDDLNQPLAGAPEVPPEYRPYLLTAPVFGEIVSIDRIEPDSPDPAKDDFHLVATANVGRAAGLLPGMQLLSEQDCFEVTAVAETTCTIEITNEYDGRGYRRLPNPTVGTRVSTLAPHLWKKQ
jgi:hypothetical protein